LILSRFLLRRRRNTAHGKGTGKKQFILFKSKSDGEAEIRRILNRGSSSKPQITEADEAAFTLAKDEGLNPQQMLDAIRLYKQQVLGVTKKATLQEAADAFIKYQEHERRNIRTIYSDRQALRDKLIPALGGETPMTEVTLQKIEIASEHSHPEERARHCTSGSRSSLIGRFEKNTRPQI
jgi:hypothetical protein